MIEMFDIKFVYCFLTTAMVYLKRLSFSEYVHMKFSPLNGIYVQKTPFSTEYRSMKLNRQTRNVFYYKV